VYGSRVESVLSGQNHLDEKSPFRPCGRDVVGFFKSGQEGDTPTTEQRETLRAVAVPRPTAEDVAASGELGATAGESTGDAAGENRGQHPGQPKGCRSAVAARPFHVSGELIVQMCSVTFGLTLSQFR
jgi:hypothetical protein